MDVLGWTRSGVLGVLVLAGCALSAGPPVAGPWTARVCEDRGAEAVEDRGMGRVAAGTAWRVAARCPTPDWPSRREPAPARVSRADGGGSGRPALDRDERPWGAGGPPAPRALAIAPLGPPVPAARGGSPD